VKGKPVSQVISEMRIGELAARAGVSTRALRYYEEQGLLHPERTPSGQRVFTEEAVTRVLLIQQLFTAGLSSRLLVRLLPAIDSGRIDGTLARNLEGEHDRLAQQIVDMQAAHRRLAALIDLSSRPHDAACPATLEEAANRAADRAA
jgi:DNA-binding transcriptional MerR regulator